MAFIWVLEEFRLMTECLYKSPPISFKTSFLSYVCGKTVNPCEHEPTEHRRIRSPPKLESLKLELQELVSRPLWVTGAELGSSP